MKLLLIVHAIKGGGAERVAVNLANKFVSEGHYVSLSCDTTHPFSYAVDERIKVFNHREYCEDTPFWSKFAWYRFVRMEKNIRNYSKDFRPDFVISFMTKINIDVILALMGSGIPVIATEHTNVSKIAGKFNKLLYNKVYPFATAITVLTRFDYKRWHCKFKNLIYMPNPIVIEEDSHIYQSNCRKKVVLTAGRVDAWYVKGFDNLIKAWSMISHKHPGWELHIAGNSDAQSIEYLLSLTKNEARESIKFLGFRNDINKLMSESKVYVLTSRWEGLPMSLLEAMNMGCCCLAFDVETGPSDIIKDGVNGMLVKNQNVEDLANKLSLLMSDETLVNQLSQKAHEGVLKFGDDYIVDRWYKLFELINKKK